MRIESHFLYAVVNGKKGLYDSKGNPVSLDSLLKQFKPDAEHGVAVRLIADDGRHEQVGFDPETAKRILGQKMKGYFTTIEGKKVVIYNASAEGEYPVIGTDPSGYPCLWTAEGKPSTGDESLSLVIQKELTKEETKKEDQ